MGEVQFGKYEKIRLIDVCFNLATRKDGRKTIFISPTRKIIHTRVSNLHRSSFKAFLNKKWNDFRGVYHLLCADMDDIMKLVFLF